jgi:hypothetical protein
MATQAQIDANRRNAQNSTGPRTPEGKETVAANALKHGLCAERAVVLDESAADFADFSAGMHRALAPADEYETALAERIVQCEWRLRRVVRMEAAAFDAEAAALDRDRALSAAAADLAGGIKSDGPDAVKLDVTRNIVAGFSADQLAPYADPLPRDGLYWPQLLEKISRYEAAIERQLHRATVALERRQAQRRAASETKPIRQPAPREKLPPPTPRIAPPAFAIGHAAEQTQFVPPIPPQNGQEIASLRSQ